MDEDKILMMLKRLNRTFGAIHSMLLALYLEMSDRTVRWWLRKLEEAGKVVRPYGKHRGWRVL